MGHPEHDVLFVVTQVVRAAGLKDSKSAINDFRVLKGQAQPGHHLTTLMGQFPTSLPKDHNGRPLRTTTIMFTKSEVMYLDARGRAPPSTTSSSRR